MNPNEIFYNSKGHPVYCPVIEKSDIDLDYLKPTTPLLIEDIKEDNSPSLDIKYDEPEYDILYGLY